MWPFKWKLLSSTCTFLLCCWSCHTTLVVLTFESVDEILKCDHANESYWAVLSCCAVDHAIQGGSNFWVCEWNPKVWPFKWKLLSSTFLLCSWSCHTRWFYEILKCDHSNESYSAVLSCCAVDHAIQGGSTVPFESVDEILKWKERMKAPEQHFPRVRFIVLYKLVVTFGSNGEILKCKVQSNEKF